MNLKLNPPAGVLKSALSLTIVHHLRTADAGCELEQIACAVLPAPVTKADLIMLRQRLCRLGRGGYVHHVQAGTALRWKAGPDPDEDEEEAVPAVAVASSRRISVMAGVYVPPRNQVLRPGADHRHLQSRGIRC